MSPPPLRLIRCAALATLLLVVSCQREAACPSCDTLVVTALSEPSSLVPPLVGETVGRDISDQIFERLADLAPGAAPIDTAAYRPGLAARWERLDSLRWRFHLQPGRTWHDGAPVTAEDVRFSFAAFSDPEVDALALPSVAGLVVTVEDSLTVTIRFPHASAEQLYDATYHVRILPAHLWRDRPLDQVAADTALSELVGTGPYRLTEWRRGQYLRLEAAPGAAQSPAIRHVIWRFAPDPDAAVNLLLSHEADVLETVPGPERVARVAADSTLRLQSYPSAVYGFLAFRLQDGTGRPHPLLGDRALRRALAQAIDRPAVAQAVFGPGTLAPPGPMSRLLWIWDERISVPVFDTSAAAAALDRQGWRRGRDGVRSRAGRALAFDILVPATSATRRELAQVLQESWRRLGVRVSITTVDFPVFQQRLGQGRFDSFIGAWLDEPSPRSLADQWTRGGWGALNFGHYANPAFDQLVARASSASDPATARSLWREAMDTLNADAPALFLYTPQTQAALTRRLADAELDPYSWASGLPAWRLLPPAKP